MEKWTIVKGKKYCSDACEENARENPPAAKSNGFLSGLDKVLSAVVDATPKLVDAIEKSQGKRMEGFQKKMQLLEEQYKMLSDEKLLKIAQKKGASSESIVARELLRSRHPGGASKR